MIDWLDVHCHPEQLLALTFGNALMLFFGLAAAIPLLIHLWSRNRYAEQPFAAMEFLMRAVRKHSKRIAIENWFLFALRTIILVWFILTVADPLLPTSSSSERGGTTRGSRLWIVVLDHSYSMGVQQAGQTRLQVAQMQLEQLLQEAPDGDAFSLIAMGRETEIVIGEPVFDRREVSRYAQAIRLSPGPAQLDEVFERVEQVIDSARGWSDAFDSYRVLFFSDMGKVTWDAMREEGVRERIGELANRATLAAIDVGTEVETQYAITQVSRDAAWALPGQSITLDVQLQAYGAADAESSRISMMIDGQPVSDRQIVWNRERQRTESFTTMFNAPGEYVVAFRLGNDPLTFDNEFQFLVRVRPQIRVLLVGSRHADTLAIATALKMEGAMSNAVKCQQILDHEWSAVQLTEFDVVVLSNVRRIRRDVATQITAFVERGGCLLVGLGPDVEPNSLNSRLGGEGGVLPATLIDETFKGETRLALGTMHPIVGVFAGNPNSGIETVPIWRYQELEVMNDNRERARTVMNFETGSPAMLEKRFRAGTCYLYASSFQISRDGIRGIDSRIWSPLPVWPVFLPLIHEVMIHGLRRQDESRNLSVGDPIEFALPVNQDPLDSREPIIVFPSGKRELAVESSEHPGQWFWPNADEVGIYRVERELKGALTPGSQVMGFAVEYNPEESETERVDGTILPSQIEMPRELIADSRSEKTQHGRTRPYQWMLLVLLAALLFESWLAMRMGREVELSRDQGNHRIIAGRRQPAQDRFRSISFRKGQQASRSWQTKSHQFVHQKVGTERKNSGNGRGT